MIRHLSYIVCDMCGAPAKPAHDAQSARGAAQRLGFVSIVREHDNGRVKVRHDYCPTCAPDESRNDG